MLRAHYPLQALLYAVALHRYLRWRQPGYDPERHLGGVQYLFVRGMVGPQTPPGCGVFDWQPPAALVVALSDLLAGVVTVLQASGVLAVFAEAGVLAPADVHVARRLGELARETDDTVLLATALAVRAVRLGSTCLDLRRLRDVAVDDEGEGGTVDLDALPWPSTDRGGAGAARAARSSSAARQASLRPLRARRHRRRAAALPRPVLAAGAVGPRDARRPGARARRRSTWRRVEQA